MIGLYVGPDLSDKYFIIEMVSYLATIQGTAADLINECNCLVERIPWLEITAHEIQSSEMITNRDTSLQKKVDEVELCHLVNEGPYQSRLEKFSQNET